MKDTTPPTSHERRLVQGLDADLRSVLDAEAVLSQTFRDRVIRLCQIACFRSYERGRDVDTLRAEALRIVEQTVDGGANCFREQEYKVRQDIRKDLEDRLAQHLGFMERRVVPDAFGDPAASALPALQDLVSRWRSAAVDAQREARSYGFGTVDAALANSRSHSFEAFAAELQDTLAALAAARRGSAHTDPEPS